jgi:phosphoribosylaminoimidazolecarboxamide formyltransferase / IMP cyclohydrolase
MSQTKTRALESHSALRIGRALLSVFDKTGLVEFAKVLSEQGVSLIATGGTRTALENADLKVSKLENIAKFPEMLDGRVKTLQPEIFAGILANKQSSDHMKQIAERGVETIDMVVCNFYPFDKTAQKVGTKEDELIEMIDIGGPSMVRASAKNFESVCVVPSPRFYKEVSNEIVSKNGYLSFETRQRMSLAAFEIVAAYDISIYNTLHSRFRSSGDFPDSFFLSGRPFESPKYGENPNQKAMIYSIRNERGGVAEWKELFGDKRSYNNYLDIGSSYEILKGFQHRPAAATVKHGQISGFAFSNSIGDAYALAHSCDPEADFGNTTILNRAVDASTAQLIGRNEGRSDDSVYTEIVLAPGYEPEALEILKQKQKKKIRIIEVTDGSSYPYDVKVVEGLVLVQQAQEYSRKLDASQTTSETKRKPTKDDLAVLLGLWEVVRRVESNGVVVGNGKVSSNGELEKLWTLGVGSFRKRNGATRIALENASARARDAYCASDGFFPFPDSIELLGQAGVKAVIQPGGSLNDRKVIEACDRNSIAMVFTHERAFKH